MAGFRRELIKLLEAAGCVFLRHGRGDHEIWFSPITNRPFTVDAGVKSRHTANQSLKDAGLPKHF